MSYICICADPAGFVTDAETGEPVELCAGGARRRLEPTEASLREWVDGVVCLWLRHGVALQVCVCARACACAFVCVCVRACVRACVGVCV